MNTRRIIRPFPSEGIELLPPGSLSVDGKLDYLETSETPVPIGTLYAATDNGETVILDTFSPPRMIDKGKKDTQGKPVLERAPNTHWHSFAGWKTPGEPVEKKDPLPL